MRVAAGTDTVATSIAVVAAIVDALKGRGLRVPGELKSCDGHGGALRTDELPPPRQLRGHPEREARQDDEHDADDLDRLRLLTATAKEARAAHARESTAPRDK
jgi:hypothetical protein